MAKTTSKQVALPNPWNDTAILNKIDQASKSLVHIHDNYDLRALYWETFFFSIDYSHQASVSFPENPDPEYRDKFFNTESRD